VVEDAKGNPWIGTMLGLQQLNIEMGTFTNFDVYDGLPGLEINQGCRDLNGWLYFSTEGKVFRFHPDSLPVRDYSAPVYLMDFFLNYDPVVVGAADSILQKMLRYTSSITLPFNNNNFGLSFTMPVFYKPEETTYYYRLSPYQSDWQAAGTNRAIHYTNIDPGTYTFEVKSQTATGFWSTRNASIEIVILPPWYQTWWARTLWGLLAGAAFYFFYRQRLHRALEKADNRRLQELNALKTRLYTNITHEFRTPLTVIMGMVNNIKGHNEEKQLIKRNSKNLLRLVNQLLDMSKLDSGLLKVETVHADIIYYLKYLTESFFSMANEKQIQLSFSTELQELFMDFDEEKIQHIIYNLLSNALKFTPEGGTITLHVKDLQLLGKPHLQIKISDTGTGIPPEDLPFIFNRFYQVENTKSTAHIYSGTGIGLAITKELVELLGGHIVVESRINVGSDFLVFLPITQAAVTSQKVMDSVFLPSQATTRQDNIDATFHWMLDEEDIARPSLLIIEDNQDVIRYIESLLQKSFQIETASNGQEGIDKALASLPDIIISDVMMPQKDGYTVCQELKKDDRSSHIPIILLTAKATTEDRMEGLRGGADAYLVKPFNKEELFIRLEQLINLRKRLQQHYSSKEFLLTPEVNKPIHSPDEIFLHKLIKTVRNRLDDTELSVDDLCQAANLSNMQVNRKLKALTGKTPSRFIRAMRLQKALELLQTTNLNISEIAYNLGFSDPNYFSRVFSEEFGYPPGSLRK